MIQHEIWCQSIAMNPTIPTPGADHLGTYLTAALGFSTPAATSDAAIVNLDFSAFSGPNAGLASGASGATSLQDLDARPTGTLHTFNAKIYPSTGMRPIS
jgi:hypothetical protein